MSLTEYETTVVLRADAGGDTIESTLDKVREAVRSRGGKLLSIKHWGKKKLAYDIAKQSRGTYVHAQYLGAGSLVHEIERNLRISDAVLRFLTIRLADDVAIDERQEQAYERPAYNEADEEEEAETDADTEAASGSKEAASGEQASEGDDESAQAEGV